MFPVEFKELKTQFDNLMEKWFITKSIALGSANFIYQKEKYVNEVVYVYHELKRWLSRINTHYHEYMICLIGYKVLIYF